MNIIVANVYFEFQKLASALYDTVSNDGHESKKVN